MANSLSVLIPSLIASLTQVSREGIGFIEAVDQDFSDMGAQVGQAITMPAVDGVTVSDIVPAVTGPTPTDSAPTSESHAIRKSRSAKFGLTGEDLAGISAFGPSFRMAKIEEAFRQLTNEIEADVGLYAALGAGGAYGTAGTNPFGSNLADAFAIEKELFDAGAQGDKHLVLDSAAWLNMGNLTQLTNVNQAGADTMLRFAKFPEIASLSLHRSSRVSRPAIGTGTAYQSNNVGGYAAGATSIAIDTGTNTVIAGDVVTFAGDANKYVVKTGVAAPGTIVLAGSGLKQALADNVAMTIEAISRKNMAFTRRSIVLSTRQPAMPEGGDSAADVAAVRDPYSGLVFQVAEYKQYKQATYEVGIAWGATARKRTDIIALLGA